MWAWGKSWETAMPGAPYSPEFIVHCCKDLNLSILEPPRPEEPLAFKEPYKRLCDTWVLGAADVTGKSRWWNSSAPQWDSFPQTHSLSPYMCQSLHLQLFWSSHRLSRKAGDTERGGRGASMQPRELTSLQTLGCSSSPGPREFFKLQYLPLASESSTHLPGREGCPWHWQ